MADPLILALDTQGFQQVPAPLGVELLLRAVDPAAAQPQFMSGQHQIAHDQTDVRHMVGLILLPEYDQHDGRTVERIVALRSAHDLGVHPGNFVAQLFVGHLDDDGALQILAAGSVEPGLDELIQQLLGHLVRLVFLKMLSRRNVRLSKKFDGGIAGGCPTGGFCAVPGRFPCGPVRGPQCGGEAAGLPLFQRDEQCSGDGVCSVRVYSRGAAGSCARITYLNLR